MIDPLTAARMMDSHPATKEDRDRLEDVFNNARERGGLPKQEITPWREILAKAYPEEAPVAPTA